MRQLRIVQSSYPGTGSTIVANLIHGILAPDEPIHWNTARLIDDCLITKTHETDLDALIARYPNFDLYFIDTGREGYEKFDKKYRQYERVLFIDYNEILETNTNTIKKIVEQFHEKLRSFLPPDTYPPVSEREVRASAVARIEKMNAVVAKLSDMPFSECDPFFHIHGSHRNRREKMKQRSRKGRSAE